MVRPLESEFEVGLLDLVVSTKGTKNLPNLITLGLQLLRMSPIESCLESTFEELILDLAT